ncbi:MAG: STAS domain-containing protein [SAR324 cluster bacterium]|nr:STAS domain-containing protein [SAR324 cluster bacterium]
MELQHRIDNQIYILAIDGDLSAKFIGEIEQHLSPLLQDENINGIVINFQKIAFVDSSGIGLVLSVYKALLGRGARLAICNLNEENVELFEMTRLNDILPIYTTEPEALDSF